MQSASILALLRTQGHSRRPSERFIGFGDPVYDYDSFKQGKPETDVSLSGRGIAAGISKTRYAELGGRLGRLEASGEEVLAIESLFPKRGRRRSCFGMKPGKNTPREPGWTNMVTSISPCTASSRRELQAIAFSQIPGAVDDGFLTMGEIMNLHYNARLVVLSACQTGLGEMERGEGVTGLTRAVIYAGSPAAVVSLWSVDDTATRELMTRFYEGMIGKGTDRSQALRKAKQEMMKTRYRHPYFWAAFIMYGE